MTNKKTNFVHLDNLGGLEKMKDTIKNLLKKFDEVIFIGDNQEWELIEGDSKYNDNEVVEYTVETRLLYSFEDDDYKEINCAILDEEYEERQKKKMQFNFEDYLLYCEIAFKSEDNFKSLQEFKHLIDSMNKTRG